MPQYRRDMQARALKSLMQLPEAKRLHAIAEGLELLVEHVTWMKNSELLIRWSVSTGQCTFRTHITVPAARAAWLARQRRPGFDQ